MLSKKKPPTKVIIGYIKSVSISTTSNLLVRINKLDFVKDVLATISSLRMTIKKVLAGNEIHPNISS